MKPRDQILVRMYLVFAALSMLPIFIGVKMIGIHLTEGKELRESGQNQSKTFEPIPAMRGAILDASGRSLAVNAARFDLEVDPTVEGFAEKSEMFYRGLSSLFGKTPEHYRKKVADRASPKYVLLLRQIDVVQKETVEDWEIPGVILHNQKFVRKYNYESLLAHVLGHVNSDGDGLAGIEKQYNDILKGTDGKQSKNRDRRGAVRGQVGGAIFPPEHGQDVVLTIDLVIQNIVEEELRRGLTESGAKWGTIIAMDPRTGAIIAMANAPTFNPNRAQAYSDAERRNRAITDLFEPGSTLKLVTAAAAIERGIVKMTDSIETGNGYWHYGPADMKDTHGWGTITFAEGIAHSSNIAIAKTARELEKPDLYQYARNLGFAQKTWIDLPGEARSLLKKPDQWSGTTPMSLSIGYETNVTALQVLTAFSALANDGLLVQPHVLKEVRNSAGDVTFVARPDSVRRAFKKRTARTLLPAFEKVVTMGTAKQAQVENLRIAGKTGTANKITPSGYSSSLSRASFVGFLPVQDPQIAIMVLYDEPRSSTYGGVVAAPVFQRIAKRLLPTLPSINKYTQIELAEESQEREPFVAVAPEVEGMPAGLASTRLRNAGFTVRPVKYPTRKVSAASVNLNARTAKLIFAEEADSDLTHVMPDVRGLSVRQAMYWLKTRGIEASVSGHGVVKDQFPEAGAVISNSAASLRCGT